MRHQIALSAALLLAAGASWAADPAERTGEQIVKAQCANCHEKGLHGAPKIGDREAWIPRLKKGIDATVRTAMKGHGGMPARGGLADLSDPELRSAVLYLFNPQGPLPVPAAAPANPPNMKIVGDTEILLGVQPRASGLSYVNITVRDAKSQAVVDKAQVEVTVSDPVMGPETRTLAPNATGKVVSYGELFAIRGQQTHTITVKVRRPGVSQPIETKFDFKG